MHETLDIQGFFAFLGIETITLISQGASAFFAFGDGLGTNFWIEDVKVRCRFTTELLGDVSIGI
ncbi:hypothetical protein A9Z39_10135 [Paenibacillus polymyxa]|nr:hypothetical protein A9Z39_10135 [Paenibacillus polymyxa]